MGVKGWLESCVSFKKDLVTITYLELPQEVQPGRGLHLLGVKVEGQDEDGDDHRGHDLQGNLGIHHTAGEFRNIKQICLSKGLRIICVSAN